MSHIIDKLIVYFPNVRISVLRKICKINGNYYDSFLAASRHQFAENELKKKRVAMVPPLTECCCCFELLPGDLIESCSKGHTFCFKCIQMTVQNTNHEIKCVLIDSCTGIFSDHALMKILTKEEMNCYEKKRIVDVLTELEQNGVSNLFKCFHCDMCMVMDEIEMRGTNAKFVHCLYCDKKTCLHCKKAHHAPYTCLQMNQIESHEHFNVNGCCLNTSEIENERLFQQQRVEMKEPMSHILIDIDIKMAEMLIPMVLQNQPFCGKYEILGKIYQFMDNTNHIIVKERITNLIIFEIHGIYEEPMVIDCFPFVDKLSFDYC